MEYQQFGIYYVVRIDRGEEIVAALKKLCEDEQITLGWVTGIGAVNDITIGLFETAAKKYHPTRLEGDHEITSLTGNISTMDGNVYLHLHITVSDDQYRTHGGHLTAAVVSATAELIVEKIEGTVERQFSTEIGLNLYRF